MLPVSGVSYAKVLGFSLAVIGLALLVFAWTAQANIDEIGATNDETLQHRISMLEDQRNAYLVSGIGFLFMGIFAFAMLGEPSMSTTVPRSQMVAVAEMAQGTLAGLSLYGNSSYLPAKHGLTEERVFVSAKKGPTTPPSALTDDLVLSPGMDGSSPGILVKPFGLRLLNDIEQELGTRVEGIGLEAAEDALQILKHGFGILKDFHFKDREGKTVLRVEYGGLLDACRTVRKARPDTCRQLECLGCSCLLAAAARATGKLVSVEEVDNNTDIVVFTLDVRNW